MVKCQSRRKRGYGEAKSVITEVLIKSSANSHMEMSLVNHLK
jgi:hypothetical protein